MTKEQTASHDEVTIHLKWIISHMKLQETLTACVDSNWIKLIVLFVCFGFDCMANIEISSVMNIRRDSKPFTSNLLISYNLSPSYPQPSRTIRILMNAFISIGSTGET